MALNPSQRITLKKEIALRLSKEEWALVDLTLAEFSLPRTDDWTGTKDGYVLQSLAAASDNTLLEIARHLGFQARGTAVVDVEPSFWVDGMLRVFISHLSPHHTVAAALQQALAPFGISAFVAHNDIEPTLEWQSQIEIALNTCHALVALLHPDFHHSKWTDQEIGMAMGRRVPVFSIRFGADPYGFIGKFQAFEGRNKTALDIASELFDAYRKNAQTQQLMTETVVRLFENSGSYAIAKERTGYLEELEVWDPSFSNRIRAAVKENSQISGAYGVPARIEALLTKWG